MAPTSFDPIQVLRDLAVGHLPELRDEFFWKATRDAETIICNILPQKCIDVVVEGPEDLVHHNPFLLLYDFVAAAQREESVRVGVVDRDGSLGLAQQAIHDFVSMVLPKCTYKFKARFSAHRQTRTLPARDSWGKHVVKEPPRLSNRRPEDDFTPFKEVPR